LTPSQLYVFMPPNLGGFFMVRSYYPSECHADYFDFERIEALKPAIEAIQEPPSGDLQERVLIRHHDYDQCFQSVQLLQWNSQVKFNVTVYRNLPTTRDSIMTS